MGRVSPFSFHIQQSAISIRYRYDEGTAFMPVVSYKRQLPTCDKYNFMALDEDGLDLPPDWYMRICGFAVEGLRGARLIL